MPSQPTWRENHRQLHDAAWAAGRDPTQLTVDRPFLGGSPRQFAKDLEHLERSDVDHVLFANLAASTEFEMSERFGATPRHLDEASASVAHRGADHLRDSHFLHPEPPGRGPAGLRKGS